MDLHRTSDATETRAEADVAAVPVPRVLLREYDRYDDAERAVDRLSDEGFPVGNLAIIWSRLRRVEYITGRRTAATAAREGALAGVWLGAVLGVLLALFVELDDGTNALALVLTYAVIGAAVGAVTVGFMQWTRRGRRDFGSSDRLDAEGFELWVDPAHFDRADTLLGTGMGAGG